MNNQLHRRILSALLALAIFMSCCPVTAISAQTQGETEYPINEVAKVVSIFPVLWKDPTNNDPALQVPKRDTQYDFCQLSVLLCLPHGKPREDHT